MKSRVFTITSLLALLVAFCAASVATAQDVTPGGDVYVKDFVQGGGNGNVKSNCESSNSNSNSSGDNCGGNQPSSNVQASCADGASVDSVTGQPCSVATVSSGDLPFTGFQAGLVALAGLGLIAAGFGMRRMTRNSGNTA